MHRPRSKPQPGSSMFETWIAQPRAAVVSAKMGHVPMSGPSFDCLRRSRPGTSNAARVTAVYTVDAHHPAALSVAKLGKLDIKPSPALPPLVFFTPQQSSLLWFSPWSHPLVFCFILSGTRSVYRQHAFFDIPYRGLGLGQLGRRYASAEARCLLRRTGGTRYLSQEW
jgi:hypothetical protein